MGRPGNLRGGLSGKTMDKLTINFDFDVDDILEEAEFIGLKLSHKEAVEILDGWSDALFDACCDGGFDLIEHILQKRKNETK